MRVFTTMANQFFLLLIWLYFTHYFLTPKETGWKRELISLPLWFIQVAITATVLWNEVAIKFVLCITFIFFQFCYIYVFDLKRFLIAIALIYINSMICELAGSLIILTLFQRPIESVTAWDNFLMLPGILAFSLIMFSWILKKQHMIKQLPGFAMFFLLSQLPLTLLVDINGLNHRNQTLILSISVLVILELVLQIMIWRKYGDFYDSQKQRLLNHKLQEIYTIELNTYLEQRDQEQLQRKLRHDLLNEIQTISIIENGIDRN